MARAECSDRRRRWLAGLRAAIRAALRCFTAGMYYQSPVFDLQVAQAIAARGRSRAGYDPYWAPVLAAPELPPGHPEALAAGVPLSPGERALWSDVLGRPVRRRRPWHR